MAACSNCGARLLFADDEWLCPNGMCPGHRPEAIQLDFEALARWRPFNPDTATEDDERDNWRHK